MDNASQGSFDQGFYPPRFDFDFEELKPVKIPFELLSIGRDTGLKEILLAVGQISLFNLQSLVYPVGQRKWIGVSIAKPKVGQCCQDQAGFNHGA